MAEYYISYKEFERLIDQYINEKFNRERTDLTKLFQKCLDNMMSGSKVISHKNCVNCL